MPLQLTSAIIIVCLLTHTLADFDCLCNYNVETNVLDSPSANGQKLGTLYEFDCKPVYAPENTGGNNKEYLAVQYENKIGYIKKNDQIQEQICPGLPSSNDIITTTSTTTESTTSASTTETSTKLTTSTLKPSTILLTSSTPKVTTARSTTRTRLTSTATLTQSTQPITTITSRKASSTTIKTLTTAERRTMISTKPSLSTSTVRTTQQQTTTTQAAQAFNVMGTPLQYIGIGYNLLRGNPDGNQYGSTNLDEGLKVDKRILQITKDNKGGPIEAHYSMNATNCSSTTHASILFDEKSYQGHLFSLVRPSKTNLEELTNRSFTLSPEFKHLYPNGSTDLNIYRDVTTTCTTGYARYKFEQRSNGVFGVTKEFAAAVCQLPLTYDLVNYLRFLETWGTSIVTTTKLGQRTTKRFHISKLQAFQHVQNSAPNLVKHTGPYMGYRASLSIDTDNYTLSQTSAASEFGTIYSTINLSGQNQPRPIGIDVVPITEALESVFWKQLRNSGIVNRICPPSFDLVTIQKNIETALQSYASALSAPVIHSNPLRIPVTWPVGTYGLMKTNTGCPGGKVNWAEGWRKQDTEDHDAANHYPSDIYSYMAGQYEPNNLRTDFCIKTVSTSTQYDRQWPKGQYCLLQYNNCPIGFQRGYLLWDDEDSHNHNAYGGTMPTGSFNGNTKMYYCCRTDGQSSHPISLPTDNPFILVRYGSACQTVYNMKVKQIYVRWDDEDTGNFDSRWGIHPYDDGGSKDHRLYFCHYQSNQGSSIIPGIVG